MCRPFLVAFSVAIGQVFLIRIGLGFLVVTSSGGTFDDIFRDFVMIRFIV